MTFRPTLSQRRWLGCAVAACFLASFTLFAQELMRNLPPPPPDPNDFKVSSDVELVLLDVSVKDRDGGYPSELTREQFRILEDGKPVEISVFNKQDVPVTVGLVVDSSGSVRPKRSDVITASMTLVQKSNPKDELFLVTFNDSVRLGLPESMPFTDDYRTFRQTLLDIEPRGRTALYDGLKLGMKHLGNGRCDKKTLVVISDGGDNSSEATLDDVVRMAQESLATIYTVGIFTPDDKEKNPGVLKKLAALTGGQAFMTQGEPGELVPICEKIAKDIRNRYTIGYVPQADNGTGKARKIKVEVNAGDGRQFAVRTRTEYRPFSLRSAAAPSGNSLR